jgi:DNA topoisomerase-1
MKINRIGTYKTGFKYFNKNIEITNENDINFYKSLKIPPAYDNVTILNGKKIIAYGYDSKNRKQVIYNPKFIEKQNNSKFIKIEKSIKYFKKFKNKIKKDILGNDIKNKIISIIITLIIDCGFRIGNKKYEKEYNSYGLTTLKKKHIFLNDKTIKIDFIGKKNVRNVAICNNKYIYDYIYNVIENLDDAEDYIFKYGDKCVSSNDVNKYLDNFYNKYDLKITTKDLRTLNANNLFIKYYRKYKDDKHAIKKAINDTSLKLHNTSSVCKKNYIDPRIIKLYENKNK